MLLKSSIGAFGAAGGVAPGPGPFKPTDISQMAGFVDPLTSNLTFSTGSQVQQIDDETVNGRNYVQLTPAQQPVVQTVNGLVELLFDGDNDYMEWIGPAIDVQGPWTLFFAMRQITRVSQGQTWWNGSDGIGDSEDVGIRGRGEGFLPTPAWEVRQFQDNILGTSVNIQVAHGTNLNQPHWIIVSSDGAQPTRALAAETDAGTSSGALTSADPNPISHMVLGAWLEDGGAVFRQFINMGFYAWGLYTKAVVGTELDSLKTWLDDRIAGTPPSSTTRADALETTGLRTVYVSKSGSDSNNGLSPGQAKLTIQGGLNILQAGDVMVVEDGTYDERPSISGLAGTVANPIWIAARNPGQVIIADEWEAARNGTLDWGSDLGSGVYRASHADVYMGHHNGDFLLSYRSRAALESATVEGQNKPEHGLAFEGGFVYVRLRNRVNPNGQEIHIAETFGRTLWDLDNCDNVIIDGFDFIGAGNSQAVNLPSNCANPTVTNCRCDLARFMVRGENNVIMDYCEYFYTGFGDWFEEVNTANPGDVNAAFDIIKDHFASGGNAFAEGSILLPPFGSTGSGNKLLRCYVRDVFDGIRLGEYSDSEVYASIWERICDNAVQFEADGTSAPGVGNNIKFHNNLIKDNFGPCYSHTGGGQDGDTFVFRNIMQIVNATSYITDFVLKTIALAPNLDGHHFQNQYRITTRAPTTRFLWYAFSNGNAQRIINFRNNIVITDDTVTSGSGGNPVNRVANAYAGPSANTLIQGTGGVFAGVGQSAMQQNPDFTLQAGSPARGIGQPLPAELEAVDVLWDGTNLIPASNDDAGAFPFEFDPGDNWPRELFTAYNLSVLPERWTSPGA